MTKKFLVQVECGDRTKWLLDEKKLMRCIANAVDLVVTKATQGTVPRVRVLRMPDQVHLDCIATDEA